MRNFLLSTTALAGLTVLSACGSGAPLSNEAAVRADFPAFTGDNPSTLDEIRARVGTATYAGTGQVTHDASGDRLTMDVSARVDFDDNRLDDIRFYNWTSQGDTVVSGEVTVRGPTSSGGIVNSTDFISDGPFQINGESIGRFGLEGNAALFGPDADFLAGTFTGGDYDCYVDCNPNFELSDGFFIAEEQ